MSKEGAPSVFVSYAWEAEDQTALVDQLEKACEERGVNLLRDTKRITYKGSIRQFMNELGAAHYVVVVLSDPYLKSEFCMYELLEIDKNKQFHKRVYPIVLPDAKIHRSSDRLDYRNFWEQEKKVLEKKTKDGGLENIDTVYEDINLYADIRRRIDKLMGILADMNTLTQDTHRDTDFDALLSRVFEDHETSQARIQFRDEVQQNIRKQLKRQKLSPLQKAVVGALNEAHFTLNSRDEASILCEQDIKSGIDVLHKATQACMEKLEDEGVAASRRDEIWEEARTILGWLILLSVNEEWACAKSNCFGAMGADLRLEIPLETDAGAEVVVSRLARSPAGFATDMRGANVYGKYGVPGAIPEAGFASGDQVLELKKAIWKTVIKGEPPHPFSETHDEQLNYTLKVRGERGEHHYIAVPVSERNHPLNNESIYHALKSDLPALNAVFIGGKIAEAVLVIPEPHLLVLIREFLLIHRKST